MKKLFTIAERYVQQSDWKVFAALKISLISLGIMIGMKVAPKHKKAVLAGCLPIFLVTYLPLMVKLIRLFGKQEQGSSCE